MSVASIQIQAFVDEIAKLGTAFTFSKNGEYLVLKSGNKDVIPFWSSPAKVQIIQVFFADYDDYKIMGMALMEFCEWLPEVEEQDLCIGLNWSGKNLEGYDIAPTALQELLASHVKKKHGSKETVSPPSPSRRIDPPDTSVKEVRPAKRKR